MPAHKHSHTKMFAPIFICIAFGIAIVAVFTFFMVPKGFFNLRSMDYVQCMKLKDSRVLEMYPPVCVTKDGKKYSKDLPTVKMMDKPATTSGY